MSGNVGEGIQYELIFDTSTYSTHKRSHVLHYTGVDLTCETADGATAYTITRGMAFAGMAFIDFPYVEMSAALASPYDGTNMSIPYPGGETGMASTDDMITVLHRCRAFCIPQATIAAGATVFTGNSLADHDAANTHDGMVEAAVLTEQDEVDGIIGIAETGYTVPGTHTGHVEAWDQNDGQYTGVHEAIWVSMWR